MEIRSSFYVLTLIVLALGGSPSAAVTLVKDGRPAGVIVLAEHPSAAARAAAAELQYHIRKMSGAMLPIINVGAVPADDVNAKVLIGRGAMTDAPRVDLSALPPEGYVVKTLDNTLVLAGDDAGGEDKPAEAVNDGDVRCGSLYAVYGFLQDQLGCRWVWPGPTGEYIPWRATVEVDALDISDAPALERRHMRLMMHRPFSDADKLFDRHRDEMIAQEAQWYLRMRMGRHAAGPEGHSFRDFWERYKDTKPEILALLPNGTRGYVGKPMSTKMCVGNPELWDLLAEQFRAAHTKDPDRHALQACEADGRRGHCTCELCRAMDVTLDNIPPSVLETLPADLYEDLKSEEDGLPGTLSTRYAKFLNEMCRRVRAIDPDGYVTMYAMTRLRETPIGVTMESNLMVNYVGFNQYPMSPAQRAAERRDFKGWITAGAKVVLRPNAPHYAGDGMPYNIAREMADDFEFALDNGLVQAEYDAMLGYWASWGPTYYVIPRLMWEGERVDPEQLIDEWYAAFGPAQRQVRAYYDYWEQYIRSVHNQPGFSEREEKLGEGRLGGIRAARLLLLGDIYNDDVLAAARALLDEARQAAEGAGEDVKVKIENIELNQRNTQLTARVARLARAVEDDPSQQPQLESAREELLAFRRSICTRNAVNVFWETQYEIIYGDPFGWKSTREYAGASAKQ